MQETTLPSWSARLPVYRPPGSAWDDLLSLVAHHYRLHAQAVDFIGPFNSKQRGSGGAYVPPTRDQLKLVIRQGKINDFTYQAFVSSLIRFCEKTKGTRALPTPHPSTIHSIQLAPPTFELQHSGPGVTALKVMGISDPIFIKGAGQPERTKFVILRPRLSKLGTASATNWEVLLFQDAHGYIPEWTDSHLNPRYAGVL